MAKIFISYSIPEKELAVQIIRGLNKLGNEVFVYSNPGDNLPIDAEKKVIDNSDLFLVMVTGKSFNPLSNYAKIEYAKALSNRIKDKDFVIPLIYGETKIPEFLKDFSSFRFDEKNINEMIRRIHDTAQIKSFWNIKTSDQKTEVNSENFSEILRLKSVGQKVVDVQSWLKELGFFKSVADGFYGPATESAVKSFQYKTNLDMTGEVDLKTYQTLLQTVTSKSAVDDAPLPNSYWIIKLNPVTWDIKNLKDQEESLFRTYNLQAQKRQEYDLFFKVKEGDKIIGYAFGDFSAVVCLFEVLKPVYNDENLGEGIRLKLTDKLDSPIRLADFKEKISFANDLDVSNPVRLISITKEIYDSIINTKSEKEEPKSPPRLSFLSNSNYSVRDGIEPVLGVKTIATEIAELIRNLKTKELGKMIGIFGNWGRGKSFMVEQIWEVLKGNDEKTSPFIRVDFHAWKYQDTSASWAYLYEAFAKKYFAKDKNRLRRKWNDLKKRVRLNWLRHGAWPLVRLAPSLLLIGMGIFFDFRYGKEFTNKTLWSVLLTFLGIASAIPVITKYLNEYKLKEKASEVFSKYFNKPSFKDLLGIQSEIQGELRHLLECWLPLNGNGDPKKRILLFVDDIDRCSEERIVQLIDALRVMLEDEEISKRVIVIAAVDERMLKRAIKWKYHELLDADKKLENDILEWEETTMQITSEYMDKLFLSGIKLGTLTSDERVEIYKQFSKGKVAAEEKEPETEAKDKGNMKPVPTIEEEGKKAVQQVGLINKTIEQIQNIANAADTVNDKIADTVQRMNSMSGPIVVPQPKPSEAEQQIRTEMSFELSFEEDKFLTGLIRNLTKGTPRQIRIFYYRYMLARNLLTASLAEGNHEGKFDAQMRNQSLAKLLAHYTLQGSNSQLQDDRKTLLNNDKSIKITVIESLEHKDEVLIAEVMDVLEMVIAY